ncbi:MAG TPA: GGDEF domain-containing protein [Cellvibrionaceae bacterium]
MLERRCKAGEKSTEISLLVLDIDHFKRVNDTRGHDVGDLILRTFAEIVSRTVRANDHMARWGGEEFVLVCEQVSGDTARVIGEKLREAVAQLRFEPHGQPLTVTVSIGIACGKLSDNFDTLFKRADVALYKAKMGGRNLVEMAEDD